MKMISRDTLNGNEGILSFRSELESSAHSEHQDISVNVADRGGRISFNPVASCLADQISAKQIWIIKKLAKTAILDANEFSWKWFNCECAELSKQAAEFIIEALETEAAEVNN